jgi:hypothetical protein
MLEVEMSPLVLDFVNDFMCFFCSFVVVVFFCYFFFLLVVGKKKTTEHVSRSVDNTIDKNVLYGNKISIVTVIIQF